MCIEDGPPRVSWAVCVHLLSRPETARFPSGCGVSGYLRWQGVYVFESPSPGVRRFVYCVVAVFVIVIQCWTVAKCMARLLHIRFPCLLPCRICIIYKVASYGPNGYVCVIQCLKSALVRQTRAHMMAPPTAQQNDLSWISRITTTTTTSIHICSRGTFCREIRWYALLPSPAYTIYTLTQVQAEWRRLDVRGFRALMQTHILARTHTYTSATAHNSLHNAQRAARGVRVAARTVYKISIMCVEVCATQVARTIPTHMWYCCRDYIYIYARSSLRVMEPALGSAINQLSSIEIN